MHSLIEAIRMAQRGHVVWLACCTGSRLEEEAEKENLNVFPLGVRSYFHPRLIIQLRRFVLDKAIMVVHCQHSKDLATVVPAVNWAGRKIPVVLSKRVGSYVMKRDPLHRFTYGNVSRVLSISEVIRKNVMATTPMKPERVITVHHGVDTDEFSPATARRAGVRNEFGVQEHEVLTGFVGRFSPGKGHEDFLQAAALLVRHHSHVRFVIVGEASYREQQYESSIRALCGRLNLEGRVLFAGFRPDVPDVMAALDIFAFPSHAESFGAVVVEAMALERPVVSTNCDGVLDIVVDGETGLYVNPGKPHELADAIARLIGDASLRERLGKAGRARVMEMFDQRGMIDKIENIYLEVINEV